MCFICLVCLCLSLWSGCSSAPNPTPETVRTAERCYRIGKLAKSAAILDCYLSENPNSISGWRLYQDSLPEGGWSEKKSCPKELRPYLKARQVADLKERILALKQVAGTKKTLPWICFDLAIAEFANRQYRKCEKHLEATIKQMPGLPQAQLLKALLELRLVNWNGALKSARRAGELDPYLVKPYFFEAAQQLSIGEYAGAIAAIEKVRLLFPEYKFDGDDSFGYLYAYWREILSLIEENLYQNAIRTADEALKAFPDYPLFLTLKAQALWKIGQIDRARTCVELSFAKDPYRTRTVQVYRKVLIYNGDYRHAFKIWKALVPDDILYCPENQIRERYLELDRTTAQAEGKKVDTLIALAHAMKNVGWTEEALIVYGQITDPALKQEKMALACHFRFIERLRKLIYLSYQSGEYNIVELVDKIDRIARELGVPMHTRPGRELSSYFIAVREADPFDPKPKSLGAYLAKHNQCLDMGNNYGHNDIRLMNRISIRGYRRKIWDKWCNYRVIVGDETRIDSFSGYYSGSSKIAGRAFLSSKGFYIALDTIRPNLGQIRMIRKRLLHPDPPVFALPKDDYFPYSPGIADALLARSLQGVWRQSSDKEKWRPMLYREILLRKVNVVHNHELGHTVDFPYFLPVHTHIGEIIAMLAGEGFSPQNIHTRFEATAETFGLAHTDYPYYYLYQEMERLNVAFNGIFTWVPWAWYGKLPYQDPYYLSAVRIFRGISRIADRYGGPGLAHMYRYSRMQLLSMARTLCENHGIIH